MKLTKVVKRILENYSSENPGVLSKIAQILMNGKLSGSGKMLILPVDQGFEHGPARSFAPNPAAYDPLYHYELAIEAGLNAYAAPLGMLELGADKFAGCIPTILKINSANSLVTAGKAPDQAITASIKDALRLGCAAVGFTIYPGSDRNYEMLEEVREMISEAKSYGLATVVWSYPRGGELSKNGENALDVIAYAAHMAALMGANIIKVKPPIDALEVEAAAKVYEANKVARTSLSERIAHIMQASFDGRRLVVFSGGAGKSEGDRLDEVKAIRDGGGNGSIIGRNTFQRPRGEALKLLEQVIDIYRGRDKSSV